MESEPENVSVADDILPEEPSILDALADEFEDYVQRLTVRVFRMGALKYQNAVIEFHPTTPLEEVDKKFPAVHMASTELSTTPPTPGSTWSSMTGIGRLLSIPSRMTQEPRGSQR